MTATELTFVVYALPTFVTSVLLLVAPVDEDDGKTGGFNEPVDDEDEDDDTPVDEDEEEEDDDEVAFAAPVLDDTFCAVPVLDEM